MRLVVVYRFTTLCCASSLRLMSYRGSARHRCLVRGVSEWDLPDDWSDVLASELKSERHLALRAFVEDERSKHTVYPPPSETFAALRRVPFAETKVCIVGQDPYHGPGQAMGLAFSVKDVPAPPSLKNILLELESDIGLSSFSSDLSPWCDQGVLLLNSVLTVRKGEANSHAKRGWEDFTDAVCQALAVRTSNPVIFLLWGKAAKSKLNALSEHCVRIEAAHPSPLSARRGFFGTKPFSQANQALISLGKNPIDWTLSAGTQYILPKDSSSSPSESVEDDTTKFPLRIDLRCPYSEKDQCKSLGGRWDPKARTWYVVVRSAADEETARASFSRWLSVSS